MSFNSYLHYFTLKICPTNNGIYFSHAVVVISVSKEGVKFSTRGDIGTANIVCRQNTTVDKVRCPHKLFSNS